MPIYEYACNSCAHRFETIQKAAEDPLRDCPECGESTLKKLLSAPVFRLKGSGWYETDFKTGDKRNVAESGDAKGDSSASNGGGGEGKKGTDAAGGEAKTKPAAGSDATSRSKGESANDGKTSGTSGGKANAVRDKANGRPKPSG